jgi:AraC-like DNA-binding protein
MDVNHVVLFPYGVQPAALTAGPWGAGITLLRAAHADYGSAPCVRLIDSPSFLEHYRLTLRDDLARDARSIAVLIDRVRTDAPKKPSSASAHSPTYGREMQEYLNDAIARPFSLRDVARSCALSPFTASRVFHREAGIPLRTYVRRLRLRTALARIAKTCDFSTIAQELGFFDHAHFTKAFRAEFGIAPSHWREFVGAQLRKGPHHAYAS